MLKFEQLEVLHHATVGRAVFSSSSLQMFIYDINHVSLLMQNGNFVTSSKILILAKGSCSQLLQSDLHYLSVISRPSKGMDNHWQAPSDKFEFTLKVSFQFNTEVISRELFSSSDSLNAVADGVGQI